MQNGGFPDGWYTDDDGPYYSVNWTNAAILQSAIAQGPVKLGVAADQLDTAWAGGGTRQAANPGGSQRDFTAETNEDHCVSLCGYGSISWLAQQLGVQVPAGIDGTNPGYAMFTWDSVGIIDVPSMIAITQEAWLRQSHHGAPRRVRRLGHAGGGEGRDRRLQRQRPDRHRAGRGPGWTTIPIAFANGNGAWTMNNAPAPSFAGWATDAGVKVVTGNFSSGLTDIALVGGPGWNTVPIAFANGSGGWTVTNAPAPNFGGWATDAGVKVVTGNFSGSGRPTSRWSAGRAGTRSRSRSPTAAAVGR